MIKRTIEISQQPAYLSVRNAQLLIHARGDGSEQSRDPKGAGSTRRSVRDRLTDNVESVPSIPCEDVGVLLVDHPAVTYSHAALTALLEHDAAVVLCGRDHLPAGLLLPIGEHSQVVWRIQLQLSVKRPLLKRLWQQIIQAKVRAQAQNLPTGSDTRSKLLALARNIRSGDPQNVEAQAARAYWPAWRDYLAGTGVPPVMGAFRRDPDGPPPNNLLNYGYAVLRAAVARAIVAAGLLPAIGIHHRHRANAFCLADDLVEPLRPIVDARTVELVRSGHSELTPEAKRGLLELLAADVRTGEQAGPLMVALHRYAASLVKCFQGSSKQLDVPCVAPASSR